MKKQFITVAGVTKAIIKTEMTEEMIRTVAMYKPTALEIRTSKEEGNKLIFAVGLSHTEHTYDGKLLNFQAISEDGKVKVQYLGRLVDPNKEEKNEYKIRFIDLATKIEKVETQVIDAFAEYNLKLDEVEEINYDEVIEEETEEKTEEGETETDA